MTGDTADWDREVDVVVIGSGVAGLTAAIVARTEGLEPLVLEKTEYFGGASAWSVGMMWFPASEAMKAAGFEDSAEKARRYFRATVGEAADPALQEAYIGGGARALAYMEAHSDLRADAIPYPDYMPHLDGGMFGRAHAPREFDGRLLGKNLGKVRPPLPIFAPFGGMMMDLDDMTAFLTARRSLPAALHAAKRLIRYAADRLRYPRGTRLLMGNALVARLYKTLLDRKVEMWTQAAVDGITLRDGRAAGVEVSRSGRRLRIRARRGIVIATGGYPGNAALRAETAPMTRDRFTIAPESNRGDGVTMARALGARLVEGTEDDAYYVPVSVLKDRKGGHTLWPHFMLDRPRPGAIAVDRDGNRFTDEAASYHAFTKAMLAVGTPHAWIVCDNDFIGRYGLGIIPAHWPSLRRFQRAGYLVSAGSVAELAAKIGVDPRNLARHVARMNDFAGAGEDKDFGKGSNAYDLFKGDPAHEPNPCLGRIAKAPFHAVQVFAGNFGTSRGLVTNTRAQVLDADGAPIPGLYCCGNDMNSPVGGHYIGAGITLGPAVTFGYVAGLDLAGNRPAA